MKSNIFLILLIHLLALQCHAGAECQNYLHEGLIVRHRTSSHLIARAGKDSVLPTMQRRNALYEILKVNRNAHIFPDLTLNLAPHRRGASIQFEESESSDLLRIPRQEWDEYLKFGYRIQELLNSPDTNLPHVHLTQMSFRVIDEDSTDFMNISPGKWHKDGGNIRAILTLIGLRTELPQGACGSQTQIKKDDLLIFWGTNWANKYDPTSDVLIHREPQRIQKRLLVLWEFDPINAFSETDGKFFYAE